VNLYDLANGSTYSGEGQSIYMKGERRDGRACKVEDGVKISPRHLHSYHKSFNHI
jgi:hypothetical protein